jgi:hypothetical protein
MPSWDASEWWIGGGRVKSRKRTQAADPPIVTMVLDGAAREISAVIRDSVPRTATVCPIGRSQRPVIDALRDAEGFRGSVRPVKMEWVGPASSWRTGVEACVAEGWVLKRVKDCPPFLNKRLDRNLGPE